MVFFMAVCFLLCNGVRVRVSGGEEALGALAMGDAQALAMGQPCPPFTFLYVGFSMYVYECLRKKKPLATT